MKRLFRVKGIAANLFYLAVVCFFAFFLYIGAAERVSVELAEPQHGYEIVTAQEERVEDPAAPTGVRRVYRLEAREGTLCFNIAHHEIRLWLEDQKIYTLTGDTGNRIAENVGSNWCSVDFDREDAGKTVTVELTPMFPAAMGKSPDFWFGDHFAMASGVLRQELPSLVLAALSVLLGMFVVGVNVYFHFFTRKKTTATSYLGLFSVSLGLWKLTDLRCMTLLLPEYTLALGYISVGSLFLTGLCLMLHFTTLFFDNRRRIPLFLSGVGAVMCLAVLAMQVFGLVELRQNLIYSHILLIGAIAVVPVAALSNLILHREWGVVRSWRLLILILAGICVDLGLYYRNNANGAISFSVVSFIIYMLVVFFGSIQDASRDAYTDSHTGLVNRTRWNELLRGDIPLPDSYAMLMLDLNGLKRINDTLGHEAGDELILRLSHILRNTLPQTSLICRWGGDEFAVVLPDVNRQQLDNQLRRLRAAVSDYNHSNPELPIHVAIGAVLSTEHPDISNEELFQLADEQMYKNKQAWYAHR